MKQVLKCIGWVVLNFVLQLVVNVLYMIPVAAEMTAEELNAYSMDNLLIWNPYVHFNRGEVNTDALGGCVIDFTNY